MSVDRAKECPGVIRPLSLTLRVYRDSGRVRPLGHLFLVFWLLLLGACTSIQLPQTAAIASAHPLATQAGHRVLDQGGNAFDAAVATAAVLSVVEPYSAGLGGGGLWLLYDAHQQRWTLIDARETAPQAAHRDMYLDDDGQPRADQPSINRALAAAIPGQPAAFAHIVQRYGRLPLSAVLQDATHLARHGFRTGHLYEQRASQRLSALQQDPTSAALFLDDGKPPAAGTLIRQPQLARTLYLLGLRGHAGFYEGPIARALVADVRQAGGIWTEQDLTSYRIIERTPLQASYPNGIRVITPPPPSSGGVALIQMLNILHQLDWQNLDPLARTHVIVEAMKLAYRDRATYLGDMDFVEVPIEQLTSSEYAQQLAALISLEQAQAVEGQSTTPDPSMHTTHLSVVDRHGNLVSATLSINLPFGSAFTSAQTGVLLNNEMDDFSLKPGSPNSYGLVGSEQNSIAPGKRPLSSMTPTIIETPEQVAVLGTPGGSRIITMVLLATLDMLAANTPDSWVSQPRFHHQYLPNHVQFEPGAFSPEQQAALRELGHQLLELERAYGNMQAILWDKTTGTLDAASDPRGEGQAIVR